MTLTTCVIRLRRRLRAKETYVVNSARPMLKLSYGVVDTRLRESVVLKNSRKVRGSCRLALPRLRRPLSRLPRRLSLWRRPNNACLPKLRIYSLKWVVLL
uniref:(northern house mosquito) hypothetical protein n=1 Tax=Culex pipiens TaxID=7175 RepID=A0A8D8AJV5_CULPI